jgi:hypothetical protein
MMGSVNKIVRLGDHNILEHERFAHVRDDSL